MDRLASSLASAGMQTWAAAVVFALVAIAAADGIRTALAAGLVGACVIATRLRFAPQLALALLAVLLVLAATGHGPAGQDRAPAPAPAAAVGR